MNKINTILLIAIMVSSAVVGSSFAIAQGGEDPYTRVTWEEINQLREFDDSYQHSQWVFGPQPTTRIYYHENGTDISDNDYRVEIYQDLDLNITVPKEFIGSGVGLEAVLFWGQNALPRSPILIMKYNVTANLWEFLGFKYVPGAEDPQSASFLSLNTSQCYYDETSEEFFVSFRFSFVEDVGPVIFSTGLQVTDTLDRLSSPSWLAAINAYGFITPPIGLGMDVEKSLFGFTNYYFAEILDLDGEMLHYVGVDDPFTLHMTANEPFGDVVIPFSYLTQEPQFLRDDAFEMPYDFYEYATGWYNVSDLPPTLTFVHNETGLFAVAGYLANVEWDWIVDAHQWAPISFEIDVDENLTAMLSEFYVLTSTASESGGAEISWTGHYTTRTDMNPADTAVGATITPDPYFWKVRTQSGDVMYARPEVNEHNTVKLSFLETFIQASVTKDGEVVHRAMQGDTLNITLDITAPENQINGTTYIPLNLEDVYIEGNYYDFHGIYLHVIRDNLTVWIESSTSGGNLTHYWTTTTRVYMLLRTRTGEFLDKTVVTTVTYSRLTHAIVGQTDVDHDDWATVLDAGLAIGPEESTVYYVLRLETAMPDMRVGSAHVATGYSYLVQANFSLANNSEWVLEPPTLDWNEANTKLEVLDSKVLWAPRTFLIGAIDPWEPEQWVVTEDGAIDLDGNVFTTEDQYFVLATGYWTDHGNVTVEGMWVGVTFDPSPGDPGDEFHSATWMGVASQIMEFAANETFYWYHADGFTNLNASELSEIKDSMWADEAETIPNPGYRYIAWLTVNRTLDVASALGLEDGVWRNTWFAWGTQQAYQVGIGPSSVTWAAFRAEYAGLLIFNDTLEGGAESAPDFAIVDGMLETDEVTHVVLIDEVDSVVLRKPFGATNTTGNVVVSPDTVVDFGITIQGVDVTIYPVRIEHSDGVRGIWQFRQSYEGAIGLNSSSFDYWITHATVDEMSFDVTFSVDMVEFNPDDETRWNHAVSFKVDQKFGNWSLLEFDDSVLDERSLAVNFFGVLGTGTRSQYKAGETVITDPNGSSLNASYFEFGSTQSPFANVTMGGLPYTWGGDNHSTSYTSGSSSAPIGAFSLMYESTSGDTVTGWSVDASMLFMTAGYENWGGHEIICDPVFVSYTSAGQTPTSTTTPSTTTSSTPSTTTTPPTTPFTFPEMGTYLLVGGIVVVVVLILVMVRRR